MLPANQTIGVIVGAVFAVLLCVALMVGLVMWRQRRGVHNKLDNEPIGPEVSSAARSVFFDAPNSDYASVTSVLSVPPTVEYAATNVVYDRVMPQTSDVARIEP